MHTVHTSCALGREGSSPDAFICPGHCLKDKCLLGVTCEAFLTSSPDSQAVSLPHSREWSGWLVLFPGVDGARCHSVCD